jgi:Phospholipase_D-nuclease N-terminal
MLASSYPFWDVVWTLFIFFAWLMFISWIVLLLIDNFRRDDHSGVAKAAWALALIFIPIIGAVAYTISRPATAGAVGYGDEPGYVAPTTGPSSATEISRLNDLRTEGAISDEEYAELKKRTIAVT